MKHRDLRRVAIKKSFIALMLVALLATLLAGAASAADGVTYVYPISDGETFDVPAGDSITLQWMWLATTKGLVHVFLKSWTASYTIYDQGGNVVLALPAAQADTIWQPIEQIDPADQAIKCASPHHWWSVWERTGVTLAPGTYTLVTEWSQSQPVNDGWHTCIDTSTGEPLASPPSLYKPGSGTWTVTIVVG